MGFFNQLLNSITSSLSKKYVSLSMCATFSFRLEPCFGACEVSHRSNVGDIAVKAAALYSLISSFLAIGSSQITIDCLTAFDKSGLQTDCPIADFTEEATLEDRSVRMTEASFSFMGIVLEV